MKRNTKRRTRREAARNLQRVKMPPVRYVFAMVVGALLPGVIGCPESLRRPSNGSRRIRVVDFEKLYMENCRGCHGTQGSFPVPSRWTIPLYLAVIPRETLRSIIANGVPGTAMIAFSEEHGGPLTEKADRHSCGRHHRLGAKNPPVRTAAGVQRSSRTTSLRAKRPSRLSARVAMARTETAATRPAPSSILLTWASLAINTCAPSLLRDATISDARIFRVAFRASRCRKRKFPALSPGWRPNEGMNSDNPSP